ncbi:hypothetical protein Tco_0012234 [Tanacetum coccineum]
MDLQDKGVIDSGCSRHMTGNMSYLTDYKEIDGGYVAFGRNPKGGKIIGKDLLTNGVVERLNRIPLIEDAWTMLADSKLPTTSGQKQFNTACYVCEIELLVWNRLAIWIFDSLSRTMKYKPIVAGSHSNGFAEVNVVGAKTSIELSVDPNMPALEYYKIFDLSSDDQNDGAEADINNLDTTIQKFGFTKVKTASTPMETQKPLLKDEDGEEVDVYMYRSMIGSLMYLTSSRPDIMFAVCACARYQVNPKCKKQIVVANSTTEAEYVAASSCCGQMAIVTEASVRRDLQLEYEEGIDCLPNSTIFEQLTLMRYEKTSQKFTFYKPFFSPQWKFLIHTILQCLSSKTTAWNEFSSTMASAIICLATNQKFNFSKYIFESMIRNLDNVSGKFLMYPRFVQVFLDQQLDGLLNHKRIYNAPSHTKKIFGNMRRVGKGFSGRVTPLFPTMVVQNQSQIGKGLANPTDPYHTPTITQSSTQPQKIQKPRKPKRKDTQVSQPSDPSDNVADEVVHKELGDSLVRVATTASSLEAE